MQNVEHVALIDKLTSYEHTESFEFRKDRPAHWLQKLCLFTLRKLKAFHFGKALSVERHTIDAKSFMERLWKQRTELHSYFNMRPTVLLIGAEDYAEMMQDKLVNQSMSFQAEYLFSSRNREGHTKSMVLNMTVHVIPWMRGCVPLTAEYLK